MRKSNYSFHLKFSQIFFMCVNTILLSFCVIFAVILFMKLLFSCVILADMLFMHQWSIPKNTNRKSHFYPAYLHILCVYIFQLPKNTFHKLFFRIFVFCILVMVPSEQIFIFYNPAPMLQPPCAHLHAPITKVL